MRSGLLSVNSAGTAPVVMIKLLRMTSSQIRRRESLCILGAAATSPRVAFAQQPRIPIVRFIGFATPEVDAATLSPFRKAMADLGYVDGRSIIIDAQSTSGDVDRG